eukprot:4805260-Amphidinium_carterae.1
MAKWANEEDMLVPDRLGKAMCTSVHRHARSNCAHGDWTQTLLPPQAVLTEGAIVLHITVERPILA